MNSLRTQPRLVGRDEELRVCGEALEQCLAGRGSMWLLAGEAGMGKSLLSEAVAGAADEHGAAVHWGRCWEAGGAPAYWPWIQIVRSHVQRSTNILERIGTAREDIARIVPELSDGASETGGALEPEQARFRLMDSVTTLIRVAAGDCPSALVLEDFHMADPASLLLLEFLGSQVKGLPLVVIVTFRPGHVARPGGVGHLDKLCREHNEIRLPGLGTDDVEEYVRNFTGATPTEKVVSFLHRATEGNPLYLVEMVKLLQARDELHGAATPSFLLPKSIKAVIGEYAGRLGDTARRLLGEASVLGRTFSIEALAGLRGCDPAETEGPLAECVRAGLIESPADNRFRFTHILVREMFHDDLPAQTRHVLHRLRADTLFEIQERTGVSRWSQLANHLMAAGPAERGRAAHACAMAAEDAAAQYAFDVASDYYEHALRLIDEDSDPRRRARLLLGLGLARINGGEILNGRDACYRAAAIARSADAGDLLAEAALTCGSAFVYGSVDPDLIDLLKDALARLDPNEIGVRARLQARLAAALQPSRKPEEPIELARRAIELARKQDDKAVLLATIRSGCSALMDLGDPLERLALNREHVQLAAELGDRSAELRGHMRIVIDTLELGDLEAAGAAIVAGERLAAETNLPHNLWPISAFKTMRATNRGDFDEARRHLERARSQAKRAQDPNARGALQMQELAIEMTGENFADARALHEQLIESFSNIPHGHIYAGIVKAGQLTRMADNATGSRAIDADMLTTAFTLGDHSVMYNLGEALAAGDDEDAARRAYDWLLPRDGTCAHWGLLGMVWDGPVSRVLALLAERLGDTDAANRHFRRAIQQSRDLGAKPLAARIAYEYARFLSRSEPAAETRALAEHLKFAKETAQRLDMIGLVRLIRSRFEDSTTKETPVSVGDPAVEYFTLQRDGEAWRFECNGESHQVRDTKGVRLLARLIASPGTELHVLDLAGAGGETKTGSPALDDRARAEYRSRIAELRAEIEEAESWNDPARLESAREELEAIETELGRAFGLGGRSRQTGSSVERARINVQRRLRDAIKRIGELCPAAGRHLEWAVKTGAFCRYDP